MVARISSVGLVCSSILACLPAFVMLGLLCSGCGPEAPNERRIAGAIAYSDSLHRRPSPPHRPLVGREDLPIATSADSESVLWVNINQKDPPFMPTGRYLRIDDGIPADPHRFDH